MVYRYKMGYSYKIQWAFSNIRQAMSVIRAIGSRSLTVINIRESSSNRILESYNGFIQYPYGVADDETIKWIQKQRKKYGNVGVYIELLRR